MLQMLSAVRLMGMRKRRCAVLLLPSKRSAAMPVLATTMTIARFSARSSRAMVQLIVVVVFSPPAGASAADWSISSRNDSRGGSGKLWGAVRERRMMNSHHSDDLIRY